MNIKKIADGIWLTDGAHGFQVESEAKLSDLLLAGAQPGTIAYTAGYASMWMLSTDETTWVPMASSGATTSTSTSSGS